MPFAKLVAEAKGSEAANAALIGSIRLRSMYTQYNAQSTERIVRFSTGLNGDFGLFDSVAQISCVILITLCEYEQRLAATFHFLRNDENPTKYTEPRLHVTENG